MYETSGVFRDGFAKLIDRWRKCVAALEDVIEK